MWRGGAEAAAALDTGSCDDTMPVMRASVSASRMNPAFGGTRSAAVGRRCRIWEARSYEYG